MIQLTPLVLTTIVGIVLQVTMYGLGHFSQWIAVHVFDFGGMMISASAAYLYAMVTGKGWFTSATAGAIAGGIAGFIGIAFSAALGDSRMEYIATATAIAVFVGAVGGLFGQMAANLRAMGY